MVERVHSPVGDTFDRGAAAGRRCEPRASRRRRPDAPHRVPRRHAARRPTGAYREHNLGAGRGAARARSTRRATSGPQRALDRLAEQDKLTGPRAARPAARPRRAVPGADRRWPPNRHYDGEAPQALLVTGDRRRQRPRGDGDRQRQLAEGRRLVPDHRSRRSSARWRSRCENRLPVDPPARLAAAPTCHLQDEIYAWAGHIFQQPVPAERRRDPAAGGRARPTARRAAAYTADALRPVDHGPRHRLRLPRRAAAGQGRDRRGGDRRGTRRRRHAHVGVGRRPTTPSTPRRRRSRWRARSSASGRAATRPDSDRREPEPPYYDPDELYGIIPDDIKKQFEMREVIARIVDGSLFHEFKPRLRRHDGHRLGLHLGHQGRDPRQQRRDLSARPPTRRPQFMQLCDRDGMPLLFLHNVTGFMVGTRVRAQRDHQGRREDADGPGERDRAEALGPVPRLAGRRQLRDGRAAPGTRASCSPGRTRARRSWAPSRRSNTLTRGAGREPERARASDPTPEEIARIAAEVGDYFERDLALLLPHLGPARRRADRPDRHPQHARHGALGRRSNAPIERTPGGVLRI